MAAGALAAAAVFAFAAYAVAAHWHAITRRAPPARSFRPSPLLPFFAAVAVAGAASGLVLAVQRWRSAPPSG